MKTQVQYGLFIITLGIFGSCAEPYKEIGTRRPDFYLNHSNSNRNSYTFNSKTRSEFNLKKIPRDTLDFGEESSLYAIQHTSAVDSNYIVTCRNEVKEFMSERTLGLSNLQYASVCHKKGASRLAPSILKQAPAGPCNLQQSSIHNQKRVKSIMKSNSRYGESSDEYLKVLGFLGIIGSSLGLIFFGFAGLLGADSLLMQVLGFEAAYPIVIDLLILLLSLFSSIGLFVNSELGENDVIKTIMIILAAIPVFLLLLLILAILLFVVLYRY